MDRPAGHHVIAIDGPAASGKSSVARELARRLGFFYVNSGAMYRAFTWHVLRRGIDPRDAITVAKLVDSSAITSQLVGDESHVSIDGDDPSDHLFDANVNEAVSLVSSVSRVREMLVDRLRSLAANRDVVMEGRDIGSVIFPDTQFKFFIDASPEVRQRRRTAQGLHDAIVARDRADTSRATAPLIIAADAEVIDTSELTIEGVVEEIMRRLKAKGLR